MAVDTRDALLARMWTLASFPIVPVSTEEHKEEILTFIEACVRPEDGTVNTDVARSIIPKKYLEDLEEIPETIDLANNDVEMADGGEEKLSGDHSNDKDEDMDGNADSILPVTPQNMYVLPPTVPTPRAKVPITELYYQIQAQPISRLLALNHKAATTDAYKESILEGKVLVTFGRTEDLKREERWCSKQRKRFNAPPRLSTLWDHILSEAKAVRAGRIGEKRQKMAICHIISQAVLEHFERKNQEKAEEQQQEPVKTLKHLMNSGPLISSSDLNKLSKELIENALPNKPVFSHFYTESITNAVGLVPVSKFITPVEADEGWRRVLIETRTEPEQDSSDSEVLMEEEEVLDGTAAEADGEAMDVEVEVKQEEKPEASKTSTESGEEKIVVKFKTKSDNDIRPPQPPPVRYISVRVGSAWHTQDDQQLLALVEQHHNNWSLISELMEFSTSKNMFTSNVERRTPWQVFERWVLLTQPDVKSFKGIYADAARQWLDALRSSQPSRKRQLPVTLAPDAYLRGHQRLRWASVLDGIRKVKRKRETVARPAAMNSFIHRQRPGMPQHKTFSARELSNVKIESDRKAAEQAAQNRMAARNRPMFEQPMQPHSGVPGLMPLQKMAGMNHANDMAAGAPPSIAGLPLPPSVAAAARMQQLKAQQAQQARQNMGHAQARLPPQTQMPTQAPPGMQGPPGMPMPGQPMPNSRFLQNQRAQQQAQFQHLRAQAQAQQQAQQHALQQQVQQAQQAQQAQQGDMVGNAAAMAQKRAAEAATRQLTAQQQQQMRILQAQRMQQAQAQARSAAAGAAAAAAAGGVPTPAVRQRVPFSREQLQVLMAQIAQANPTMSQQDVQKVAVERMRRFLQVRSAHASGRIPTPQPATSSQASSPMGSPPTSHNSRASSRTQSPHMQSPHLQNSHLQSPHLQSPHLQSPNMRSPSMLSPSMRNASINSPSMRNASMHSPNMQSPNMQHSNMQSPNTQSPSTQSPNTQSQSPSMQNSNLQNAGMPGAGIPSPKVQQTPGAPPTGSPSKQSSSPSPAPK